MQKKRDVLWRFKLIEQNDGGGKDDSMAISRLTTRPGRSMGIIFAGVSLAVACVLRVFCV